SQTGLDLSICCASEARWVNTVTMILRCGNSHKGRSQNRKLDGEPMLHRSRSSLREGPGAGSEGQDLMTDLLTDYLPLAIFIGVALAIGAALLIAPFLVAFRNPDPEKVSAYECGFNAFDDARMK